MELKKRVGKRIQELRLLHNLKQSELAEMVGIAVKTQSCIETGRNYPSAELVERYAKALNTDISEILKIDHQKDTKTLAKELSDIIKNASPEQITTIYKIVKGVCA